MRIIYLKIFFLLFVTSMTSLLAHSQALEFTGYVRNYVGVLLDDDNDYSIIQNTFDLNISHSKDSIAFKVNLFAYNYGDENLEINIREAYMDIFFNSVDIRLGKQQIIWGKADGVFITDIISPKNLSEFLLRDFDEIRIGVTALKIDYYLEDNTFEFVWIPNFTSTIMPERDSIWYPRIESTIPQIFDYSRIDVPWNLGNSEVYAKFSMLGSSIDFEIMGGYMWDDDPTMHATKNIDNVTHQLSSVTISPMHHRLGLVGGSFSATLGGFIIRGEGAYYMGKYFNSSDPAIVDGATEKDYFHYLIGLDYTLWDIRLSVQFIQQAILDYDEYVVSDQYLNTITVLASKDFLRETLRFEIFAYIGLNDSDALIRPKVTYDFADGFELLLGANIFIGDEGMFGQYDDNDMIYTKVKYSF